MRTRKQKKGGQDRDFTRRVGYKPVLATTRKGLASSVLREKGRKLGDAKPPFRPTSPSPGFGPLDGRTPHKYQPSSRRSSTATVPAPSAEKPPAPPTPASEQLVPPTPAPAPAPAAEDTVPPTPAPMPALTNDELVPPTLETPRRPVEAPLPETNVPATTTQGVPLSPVPVDTIAQPNFDNAVDVSPSTPETIIAIVENTELPEPTIINPSSKFIIATYWWGKGKLNPNSEHPCKPRAGEDKEKRIADYAAKKSISKEEAETKLYKEAAAITYDAMIERFESDCRKVNCNFITVEYTFEDALSAKPVFIKKVLEKCKGKGPNGSDLAVVYLDGDMRINTYPKLFDIDGVDFMARGYNIDPRSDDAYLRNDVCFDPYIFETSGRIQYFANTPAALDLLETWKLSNIANPGKSCERVLSLVFNIFKYQCPLSYIQLPIEYSWLTDYYTYQDLSNTSVERSIIEHPECITPEDSSLAPNYYAKLIDGAKFCDRVGGKFYEYIYFGSEEMRETMGPYLEYLSEAKNDKGDKLFEVIPFASTYGKHKDVAEKNISASEKETEAPTEFDVPKILAQLKKGIDVTIGEDKQIDEKKALALEFIAYNIADKKDEPKIDDKHTMDTSYPDLKPVFDTKKPMFFSAKNPVLYHVLAMCEKPEDLTKIFGESYTFLERIRCHWLK